ncbi:FACT complex subunit SPT16-like [Acanthaster planci]|uniref:FACT complex subunit SPT16-like n=1 Tax=Acanthaster planci TaxID=133434 RepID=A0A8B7Z4S4_ACAPL|nr:FACT complex subunit SPT16-like [Acanthaster planci]
MMEQGVANKWAALVESTEPDSDKFGLTEHDEDDSDVSRSTDSEVKTKSQRWHQYFISFLEDSSDSHSDSDEEQEQWMEKTANLGRPPCQVNALPWLPI